MKYTLLDAYLCRNLGDDLMVLELCDARARQMFVAPDLTGGYGKSLARVRNLSSGGPRSWIRLATKANGYVMCGGSMFIDKRGQSTTDRLRFMRRWGRRLVVALLLRCRRRPVEVIGCNLGPIQTFWGRVVFGAFLRLSTRVTVRDEPSELLARTLGAREVERAPDMVLSYLRRRDVSVSQSTTAANEVIGLSIMEWPDLGPEQTAKQYVALGRRLLTARPGAAIRLFGFQDQVVRDDLIVRDVLKALSRHGDVTDCSYHGDVETCLAQYASCTRIVATRFHSAVLALGLGIPLVQLSYSGKITDFLNGIAWNGQSWDTAPNFDERNGDQVVQAVLAAAARTYLPEAASLHAWGR